jgi:hypothetical protein
MLTPLYLGLSSKLLERPPWHILFANPQKTFLIQPNPGKHSGTRLMMKGLSKVSVKIRTISLMRKSWKCTTNSRKGCKPRRRRYPLSAAVVTTRYSSKGSELPAWIPGLNPHCLTQFIIIIPYMIVKHGKRDMEIRISIAMCVSFSRYVVCTPDDLCRLQSQSILVSLACVSLTPLFCPSTQLNMHWS